MRTLSSTPPSPVSHPPLRRLYAATKFGLRGFALNLREDLRDTGVGVSVITPGAIRDAGMFAERGGNAEQLPRARPKSGNSPVRIRLSPDAFRASTGRVDRLVSPGHGHDRT